MCGAHATPSTRVPPRSRVVRGAPVESRRQNLEGLHRHVVSSRETLAVHVLIREQQPDLRVVNHGPHRRNHPNDRLHVADTEPGPAFFDLYRLNLRLLADDLFIRSAGGE